MRVKTEYHKKIKKMHRKQYRGIKLRFCPTDVSNNKIFDSKCDFFKYIIKSTNALDLPNKFRSGSTRIVRN